LHAEFVQPAPAARVVGHMRTIFAIALLLFTTHLASADVVIEGSTAKGNLTIESTDAAKRLQGVSRFVGNLTIQNYDGTDLAALRSLTLIEGSLIISNTKLTSLAGLGALERVYGIVWIFSNPKLAGLDGLAKLKAVEQAFTITDNPALAKLLPAGITIGEPIKKLKGSLTIRNNASLPQATAEDFRKRCTVGGLVQVENNGR
jgi:hypothetical protein